MRVSEAAFAMICRQAEGQILWLLRWNRPWKCYHVVGGHRHNDETYRQCVIREIGEELGLREGIDFQCGADVRLRIEYEAWSASAREETRYLFEVFDIDPPAGREWDFSESDEDVRWVSETDIHEQKCPDGKPISETTKRVLDSVEWDRGQSPKGIAGHR